VFICIFGKRDQNHPCLQSDDPVYTRTSFRYSPPNVHMSRAFFDRNHATTPSASVPAGSSFYRVLTAPHTLTALVLIGIILRLWAYLADTALYLDEILLSYSILDLPLVDLLTRPLPLDQVAPLGFLLVERCSVTVFGHNELALRLFPFVCAIVSLLLFRRRANDGSQILFKSQDPRMDSGICEPALAFRVFTLLELDLESISLIESFLDRRSNGTQV